MELAISTYGEAKQKRSVLSLFKSFTPVIMAGTLFLNMPTNAYADDCNNKSQTQQNQDKQQNCSFPIVSGHTVTHSYGFGHWWSSFFHSSEHTSEASHSSESEHAGFGEHGFSHGGFGGE